MYSLYILLTAPSSLPHSFPYFPCPSPLRGGVPLCIPSPWHFKSLKGYAILSHWAQRRQPS